tara:strand:+ start:4760 stop:5203 length:444 start_codon:yes stop_codon:yes gene_type:complete
MLNKYSLYLITLLSCCYSASSNSSESWIEYNQITKINIGMNKKEVISILGNPILILADTEFDNAIYLFYNYKIDKYQYSNGNIDTKIKIDTRKRSTLLKFVLIDDELTSWMEDNVTLGMAKTNSQPKNSFLPFLSYLMNIVLLIKFF